MKKFKIDDVIIYAESIHDALETYAHNIHDYNELEDGDIVYGLERSIKYIKTGQYDKAYNLVQNAVNQLKYRV